MTIFFSFYRQVPFVSILILLMACTGTKSDLYDLSSALQLAGNNRVELEKVLSYYGQKPKDSLKYKAACFLIKNMPYYSYYEGELLEQYLSYFKLLREHRFSDIHPEQLADSVLQRYGHFTCDSLVKKEDIQTVDSAYLCNNIEWAFKVWEEQPWGKNVSFNDFCEYILPYRIGDEKLTYWREEYYLKYNELLDPLREPDAQGADDPINAVFLLMQHIAKHEDIYFTTSAPADMPHVGSKTAQYKSGSCKELTDYVVYTCRALGIPCHIDFTPIRGTDNVGHFWISFYDKKRQLYSQDFPGAVGNVSQNGIMDDPKTKVYRHTFSCNESMRDEMSKLAPSVPDLFEKPMFIDITPSYSEYIIAKWDFPVSHLYPRKRGRHRIAYLCTSQHLSWAPVAWTSFETSRLAFTNIQKGDVMRIATWEQGQLRFWSDPFRIDPYSNEVVFYSAKDSLHDITLFSKFEVWSEDLFRKRMLGGVVEGSNDTEFIEKDTLYVINNVPERLNIRANSKSNKKYRYVRYYGPRDGFCNVSEVVFLEAPNDTVPLKGKIIGTSGSFDPNKPQEYTNAFDGKTWTSFNYKEGYGGWAGLDLGMPKNVSQIVFTHRNHDNYIRPGDVFELFCYNGEWKSFGLVNSVSDSLVYKDVPRDALLYLENRSRGKQQRIFTIETEKQRFW